MVLFHNINLGQRVEVNMEWGVIKGVVQYKGSIATKAGDWVGVQLEEPYGNCDGMIFGRRYFQCKDGYGLYVRASRLRFIPITRCLYNKYHRVSRNSFIDEPLFGSKPAHEGNSHISTKYHERVKQSFDDTDIWQRSRNFPLRHSISGTMPAATMKRPRSVTLTYTTQPIHSEYELERDFFTSSPSIPKIHMPYTALRNQVKRGWESAHYVREMSVPTGRDSMAFTQWNDVSI